VLFAGLALLVVAGVGSMGRHELKGPSLFEEARKSSALREKNEDKSELVCNF
jgi:hypothetical protein